MVGQECADIHSNGYYSLVESNRLITPEDSERLANKIDEQLQKINSEYKIKRKFARLKPLKVYKLAPGSEEVYRKWRVSQGVRDNQYKARYLV